jgi:hypothetical protein
MVRGWAVGLAKCSKWRSGVRQSRAPGPLDGFQMEMAALTALREDDAQQLVYCACDFLGDRCRRFSPGEKGSSTGRARPICAFTSMHHSR